MTEEESVNLSSLLNCLLECSEKACYIAQICRKDEELFQLLIEEKSEGEKNKRFVQDFKTLADVLVQETVRWEISKKFPSISASIFGEENNNFRNMLGEVIKVQVMDSVDETVVLLSKVLDGKRTAANALVQGIYSDRKIDVNAELPVIHLNPDKVGIWIDPIDSTAEYIHGKDERETNSSVVQAGLQCVCVLIGVFALDTGCPILGVVNQPFHDLSMEDGWRNKYYWGVCHGGLFKTSIPKVICNSIQKRIVVSSCEDEHLLNVLRTKYDVHFTAGAGYKCLLVARGDADLYVLSQASTYFWDTCGPHALLMAFGGSIIDFRKAITIKNPNLDDLKCLELKYSAERKTVPAFCNTGGIVAFRNWDTLIEFIQYIQVNHYSAV